MLTSFLASKPYYLALHEVTSPPAAVCVTFVLLCVRRHTSQTDDAPRIRSAHLRLVLALGDPFVDIMH